MAISTLFFIFLGAALIGFIIAAINVLSAFKCFGKDSRSRNDNRSLSNIFVVHILAGIFYVIGGLGAFITGIVWLVQAIKA